MNELHEKLLAQAHIEFAPDSKAVTARFAELIVNECIDIALKKKLEQLELVSDTKAFDSMPEGAKDHSFGRVVAINQVVADIKEHFGVEE